MIKSIDFSDSEIKKIKEWIFTTDCYESTPHPYTIDGEKKVLKLFKTKNPCINIENKVKKINLLKERTKGLDFVVTADFFVKNNGKIIGYGMPFVKGEKFNYSRGTNKKKNIIYLKQISSYLKQLHDLNIVVGDLEDNFIIQENGIIKLIDHDNYQIDNLEIDPRNRCIKEYIEKTKSFDKRFDNYFLNLLTMSVLSNISTLYIRPYNFSSWPKDAEICDIIENTLVLNDEYNEDIIVDKINDKKDFKKLRKRLF